MLHPGDADDVLPADRARPDALPRAGRAGARRLAVGRVLRRRHAEGVARPPCAAPPAASTAASPPRVPGLQLTPKLVISASKPDKRGVKVSLTCSLDCSYTVSLDGRLLRGTAVGRVQKTLALQGRLAAGQASRHRAGASPLVNAGPASARLRVVPLATSALLALAGCGGSQHERAEADASARSRTRRSGRRDPDAPDAGSRTTPASARSCSAPSGSPARPPARDLPPLRRAVDAAARAHEIEPVLAVYQLSSATPARRRPTARRSRPTPRARPRAARRADGDRRQRAEPQPLLAAAVRRRRQRRRRDRRTSSCSPRPTTR